MRIWIEIAAATFIVAAVFVGAPASCQALSASPQAGAASAVAATPLAPSPLVERDRQYLELVTIGTRISQAAAADCPGATASPGLVFDRPDQYAADQRVVAGFADQDPSARVIAVAPGSAVAEAGLRPGDRLDLEAPAPGPAPLAAAGTVAGVEADVSLIEARIAAASDANWSLPIRRGGMPMVLSVAPRPGCGGWYDIKATPRFDGVSTRRWIQVTQGLLTAFTASPDALAFVVAHEMGHRAHRLAHGSGGCGLGCEETADRMGLVYMARAGYDPAGSLTVLVTILRDGSWLDGLSGRQAVNARRLACLRIEVAQIAVAPPGPGPAEQVAPRCRPSDK